MHLSSRFPLLLSLHLTTCFADILGPTYVAPFDLSSNDSLVPAAWDEFTSVLDSYLDKTTDDETVTKSLAGLENVTFSVGAFSLHDPAVSEDLQYHYSSPFTTESANGTKEVDASTIYRVASITKLFTVYAGLLTLTEEQWNTPLSECIPELGAYLAEQQSSDADTVTTTPWDSITPWSLANQISGIARTPAIGDALLTPGTADLAATLLAIGLPLTPDFEAALSNPQSLDSSGTGALTAGLYATFAAPQPPVFLPWTTAMYTNNGFALLGIAMSNLLGNKSYDALIQETVSGPLGLNFTTSIPPTTEAEIARSAIADPDVFFADSGPVSSSGGMLSTLSDLSLFGTALLNSTQLSPLRTRQWMKPTSHTASLEHSVGAPWEIFRWTSPTTGKVVDLYTKSGDSGDATSHFVLVPDYDFGFSYLSVAPASVTQRPLLVNVILDLLTSTILPALEAQAAAEAQANFVGTYTAPSDSPVNASITIGWNESSAEGAMPALTLLEYSYNNTDVIAAFLGEEGIKPRLLPSILDGAEGQVAFQWSTAPNTPSGLFQSVYDNNLDWLGFAGITWSGVPVSEFVFEVDGEGKAVGVAPGVFGGLVLERVEE